MFFAVDESNLHNGLYKMDLPWTTVLRTGNAYFRTDIVYICIVITCIEMINVK